MTSLPSRAQRQRRRLGAEELERLGALLDRISDGFVVFDADWNFVWLNRAGAALLRRPAEELIGRSFWAEFPGAMETVVYEQYLRAAREQREVAFELFYGPLDGWFEVRAMPTGTGIVATYRNITERRRDEALLAGNRDALTRIAENAPLQIVLDAVTAMVEAQSENGALASILLASEDGRTLRHGSAPSLPTTYNDAIDGIAVGPSAGSCGTAAFTGEQVVVDDVAVHPLWRDYRALAQEAGLRACWSTPILSAEQELLGTFAIYYREPRSPGPGDQELIEQVTRTVSIAIRHDRSRQLLQAAVTAAESAAARSRRLHDLAARLTVALGPEQVARVAADYAMEALDAQAAWLALLAPDGASLESARASGFSSDVTERLTRVPVEAASALTGLARDGKASWLSSEAETSREFPLFTEARPSVGSVAVLPLRAGGRTIGALALCRDRPGEFGSEERSEAMAVAAQCGPALERAERFAASRQLAETLQRSLLTDPPEVGRLEVAVRYHPAVSAAEVGGDWYDAFLLPDGCLALAIGDVAGHDLPAAATMGQLRSMLRALACDSGRDPAEVLTRLDRLADQLALTDFTSLILAKLEGLERGPYKLRWANAGHPPPLLFLADGTSQMLDQVTDVVLGAALDSQRADTVVELVGGSTVLFYTDGLIETRDEPLDLRLASLRAHAEGHVTEPLETFCDAVLSFAHEPADDVALLAVRIPIT